MGDSIVCVVNELINIGGLPRKALGNIVIGGVYGEKNVMGLSVVNS